MKYSIYMERRIEGANVHTSKDLLSRQKYGDSLGYGLMAGAFSQHNPFSTEKTISDNDSRNAIIKRVRNEWFADKLYGDRQSESRNTLQQYRNNLENILARNNIALLQFYQASEHEQKKLLMRATIGLKYGDIDDRQMMRIRECAREYIAEANAGIQLAKSPELHDRIEKSAMEELALIRQERDIATFIAVPDELVFGIRDAEDWEYAKMFMRDAVRHDGKVEIDLDKLRQSGYCGIEIANSQFKDKIVLDPQDMLVNWDVETVAFWDPDKIKIVNKEIALIARAAAGNHSELDAFEPMMSKDGIEQWVANNPDTVRAAIESGIISESDIERAKKNAPLQETMEAIFKDTVDSLANRYRLSMRAFALSNHIPKKLEELTLEQSLAKYCIDNKVSPILLTDCHIGLLTADGAFLDARPNLCDLQHIYMGDIRIVANGYEMLSREPVFNGVPGPVEISIEYPDEKLGQRGETSFSTANGNVIAEASCNCVKIMMTTIDFSREYEQMIKEMSKKGCADFSQTAHGYVRLPETLLYKQQSCKIINNEPLRQALRETLAERCVALNKQPHSSNFVRSKAEPSSERYADIRGHYEVGDKVSSYLEGDPLGTIVEINKDHDLGITVIETDTHIIALEKFHAMDFTQEYECAMERANETRDLDKYEPEIG